MGLRTNVYVDGFNLYYRRLKYRPQLKWLNLKVLADEILRPPMAVSKVNYYTARVSGKIDPHAPVRQAAYLNALSTVAEIETHFGNFMYSSRWAALVRPPEAKPPGYVWPKLLPELVLVQKAEEKGSDVNLASHLVRDACCNNFDVAVVITNDTDLVEPIRIAREVSGKKVGLLSPIIQCKRNGKWQAASPTLVSAASWTLYIHDAHLRAAQFPDSIPGTGILRPESWAEVPT
jgi:uncharacterized LabA/DUF88 family protein